MPTFIADFKSISLSPDIPQKCAALTFVPIQELYATPIDYCDFVFVHADSLQSKRDIILLLKTMDSYSQLIDLSSKKFSIPFVRSRVICDSSHTLELFLILFCGDCLIRYNPDILRETLLGNKLYASSFSANELYTYPKKHNTRLLLFYGTYTVDSWTYLLDLLNESSGAVYYTENVFENYILQVSEKKWDCQTRLIKSKLYCLLSGTKIFDRPINNKTNVVERNKFK